MVGLWRGGGGGGGGVCSIGEEGIRPLDNIPRTFEISVDLPLKKKKSVSPHEPLP